MYWVALAGLRRSKGKKNEFLVLPDPAEEADPDPPDPPPPSTDRSSSIQIFVDVEQPTNVGDSCFYFGQAAEPVEEFEFSTGRMWQSSNAGFYNNLLWMTWGKVFIFIRLTLNGTYFRSIFLFDILVLRNYLTRNRYRRYVVIFRF